MDDVKQLRKRIDEVDEQILHSLSKRTELCKSIGLAKKKQGIPIKDLPRENDVYTHIKEKAADLGLDPAQVETIYRQIVNMCSAVQDLKETCE
ncbi:chorismate mutase [Candidatus Bathyarchaeota archaeon]|nr:chorismate mutase [Candidatus Bathyarchaeota archaeon]